MENKEVIILYTYRYMWKTVEGKLCVKYLTEVQEGHKTFQESILKNNNIVSCAREYINEINFNYLAFTEVVKEEKKEEKEK